MMGLGTVINLITIVAGTAAGLIVGGRIPERARVTMLQGVGLAVLALGIRQIGQTHNLIFPLVAVVLGGLIGELLGIEERLTALGERIRRRVERPIDAELEGVVDHVLTADDAATPADLSPLDPTGAPPSRGRFVEGFVAASLVYVVGPLAILGPIADGLSGDIDLLVVKAALDGLVSIIFAATLGWGVGFSIIPVAIYQGLITLLAGRADSVLSERMIIELTATGGLMVMGLGIRLLDLKALRVASFLPALLIAPALVALFAV